MNHRKVAGAALVASLLLVGAAGCGDGDGEEAGEKAAEELLGGDVDINTEDGSVKVTDEEGNTSEYGGGAELPEGWPEELALPDEITILGSSTRTENGVETMFVTAESETPLDELYGGVKQQLTDAEYEIVSDSNMSSDAGSVATIEAKNADYTANITMTEDTVTDKTTVLYNVSQNAA